MTQDGPDALAVSARDGSGVSGLTMSLILPVELRDLRYFLAVADELNFTRAAQQLHMSQQALSVAIRRLEQRLGVQLFDRSPRSVQLTSAGVTLVPAAQRTLAAAEHAVTQARDAAGGLIGRLTVGVSRSAYPFGAAVLRALLERTPGIELDMHQDYAQPLVDELLAGRIDAAIVYCPENNPALRYQRLSDQPAVASLHPNHSLGGTSTLSLGTSTTRRWCWRSRRSAPADRTVPQMSLEFEVHDADAVGSAAEELRQRGFTLLHDRREVPWGQTVARLQSQEGSIIGISFAPSLHD